MDVSNLSARLRESDLREIDSMLGVPPIEILREGFAESNPCFAAEANGELVALFGVVPDRPGVGRVWMLGTSFIDRHPVQCFREGRRWVARFLQDYKLLWNYIATPGPRQIAWLRGCGFEVVRTVSVGPANTLCMLFMRARSVETETGQAESNGHGCPL